MIAQICCGRTQAEDHDHLASLLKARIPALLKTSKACRGAYLLQRRLEPGRVESLVMTLYDHGFPVCLMHGETLDPRLLSEEESRLLLGCRPSPTRYDVIIDPRHSLLHADLRRRFPLRFAAVR